MTCRGGAQHPHPQNEKEPETTIRFQAQYALFRVGVAGFCNFANTQQLRVYIRFFDTCFCLFLSAH